MLLQHASVGLLPAQWRCHARMHASTPHQACAEDMQVTGEYAQPYVTTKAVVSVPSDPQRPVFDLAGAAGYNGWVLGGACQVATAESKVAKVALKAAYIGPDFAITGTSDAAFKVVTGTYWQQLDAASSVAAEVKHDTGTKDVNLNMGYCHLAPASGAPARPALSCGVHSCMSLSRACRLISLLARRVCVRDLCSVTRAQH